MIPRTDNYFPTQRVDAATKSKAEWYTNCIDYVIDAGLSYNDRGKTETQIAILHGNIPNEFYKKTLNPYNSNNEKYTRFPATMRNFDIMSDVIRRYVSEYFKGVHEFVVGASNADIILKKNAKVLAFFVTLRSMSANLLLLDKKRNYFLCFALDFS